MARRLPRHSLTGAATSSTIQKIDEMFVELYKLVNLAGGHTLIDEEVHTDTLEDPEDSTIDRGDMIVAQDTPDGGDIIKWQRFPIGSAHTVLKTSDGIDPIWAKADLTADVTGVLPVANGGTNKSSFTAGSIVFAGASGTTLTEDNSNLFWDDTNNRLAIDLAGTAPSYGLEVGAVLSWFGRNSVNGGSTTVNIVGGILVGDTTITVTSTTDFPTSGIIMCEGEMVTYTGKTATTFTDCTRGRFNSTAATHANGTSVVFIGFCVARAESTSSAILIAPSGRFYVNANGNFFEIPSGSAVATAKLGSRFSIGDTWGAVYGNGTINSFYGISGSTGYFGTASNHPMELRTNNTMRFQISTGGLLQFAGTTSSFPALKRSSTAVEVRLADDSAYAPLSSGALTVNTQGGNVDWGTYTPTRSAEANLDANVTMTEAQWLRVGNTVTVSGRFTADPTLTATATSFEMTLPIASNIGAVEDCAGVAFSGAIAGQGAEVTGSVANNTAVVSWIAGDVTSQSWSYTLTYQVI